MHFLIRLVVYAAVQVAAQQQCYYAAGAEHRGPDYLVPCNGTGQSTCCLLGDTCLSGNACYNYATGNLYQYGCTDVNYEDESCPYKCGWDPGLSPWTALEYCADVPQVDDTWVCHAPESCGCEWSGTYDLLVLEAIGCSAMGSDARVAIYAPSTLAPYVSLPVTRGGSTGYYSTTTVSGTVTWVSTAIAGYTPANFTQLTTYRAAPTSNVTLAPDVTPAPSTYASAKSYSSTPSQSLGNAPSTSSPSPTTSSVSSTSTSTTSTSSAATTSTAAPPPTPASDNGGLSTGAKAGIGAGVGGGALLLAAVALAAYLWGRQHKQREAAAVAPQPQNNYQGGQQQFHQQGSGAFYPHSPPMQQAAPPYQQQGGGHWSPFAGHQQPYPDHGQGAEFLGGAGYKKEGNNHLAPAELSTDADRRAHEIGSEEASVHSPPLSSVPSPRPGERGTEGGMF